MLLLDMLMSDFLDFFWFRVLLNHHLPLIEYDDVVSSLKAIWFAVLVLVVDLE